MMLMLQYLCNMERHHIAHLLFERGFKWGGQCSQIAGLHEFMTSPRVQFFCEDGPNKKLTRGKPITSQIHKFKLDMLLATFT